MEELLLSRGATIRALEHDGLCFTLAHADAMELAQACSRACSMLVTVEKAKTFAECLQDIIQRSGIREWAPSDDDWEGR